MPKRTPNKNTQKLISIIGKEHVNDKFVFTTPALPERKIVANKGSLYAVTPSARAQQPKPKQNQKQFTQTSQM